MPFSARVVGEHRPDYYDLESVLEFPLFKGNQGEQLALAVYDFFTSRVHGIYRSIRFSPTHSTLRGLS